MGPKSTPPVGEEPFLLYSCRSEVAHTENLSKENRQQVEAERTQLHSIAERVAYKLLVGPPTKWDDVSFQPNQTLDTSGPIATLIGGGPVSLVVSKEKSREG